MQDKIPVFLRFMTMNWNLGWAFLQEIYTICWEDANGINMARKRERQKFDDS